MSLSLSLQAKPLVAVCGVWRRDGIKNANRTATAARDRVMGFGKHKGKMLGSLPSSYLKWVSKNLRAREFEEWAILADQVLEDPVYQDRIQWEFAHSILSGNSTRATGDGVVSELLEISERFGWDWDNNTQEAGWRGVDFELLGTSKGGRIPRRNRETATKISESESEMMKKKKKKTQNVSSEGGGRRKERRDRLRVNREQTKPTPTETPTSDTETDIPRGIMNPFPGRQTLLNRFTRRTK